MAEVNLEGKGGKKKGKAKKLSTRIDFTPMVDLGFLLITFFMLTTTMIKPQTMEIAMPSKVNDNKDKPDLSFSKAFTVILGKNNKIFYYIGTKKDGKDPEVISTTYSPDGIRKALLLKNADVVKAVQELKRKKVELKISDDTLKHQISAAKKLESAPYVIIKATDDSSYKNLVDILDEMLICNIGRYAIVDITPYDLHLIENLNK